MPPQALSNPFPGLRPFEPNEDHLFFGREKETDDLLRRLRSHRFLSVVGTSGSGKSSLVRSGLIPSLHGGFMAGAGGGWRIAIFRPGEDPIGHLAEALDVPDVIGATGDLASTNRVLIEATLRRGSLGLVEAIRLARFPEQDNLLVVVDQFEELFRFRRRRAHENSKDEAVAFVKLLLEAAQQRDLPIYIVLTMRSDFIGDCMNFPGLPEAVNEGQYLVPRMTRDELRSAISGPVAVSGGKIAPRLVLRLLNDVGDNQDQLPLVQHVLMRTWDHWASRGKTGEPINLADYVAVGELANALSRHAEEAFQETGTESNHQLTERIFRALTDTFSDPRGVRRPTSVADLAAICEVPESRVVEMVEIFRKPGRSFLMPPTSVPLTSGVIVDLSHESLMRCWGRLITWAQEERASSVLYTRLSREAGFFAEGLAGLWSDPELELGLRWRRESRPTAAWARRFDDHFDRAMRFLDLSEQERERERAERRTRRVRYLQLAWGSAGLLLIVLLVFVYLASAERRQRMRAETLLGLANKAIDETLAATDRPPETIAGQSMETQELRRSLLEKAQPLYTQLVELQPTNESFLRERADALYRLGHIQRSLGNPAEAAQEYNRAVVEYGSLVRSHPDNAGYRQALANAYNWLGETLRPLPDRRDEADKAYGNALRLQEDLVRQFPANVPYAQELARTHYNRGILKYWASAGPGDTAFDECEKDLRRAVELLQPLATPNASTSVQQDLARASNNLANVIWERGQPEARALYERAINIHKGLVAKDPRNREYKFELAQFASNLSNLLRKVGELDLAITVNGQALEQYDDLARPSALVGIEHADAHNLRARILQARQPAAAAAAYHETLELYEDIDKQVEHGTMDAFHTRYNEFLENVVSLVHERPGDAQAHRVLADTMQFYLRRGQRAMADGDRAQAQTVVNNLVLLMPQVPDRDRQVLAAPLKELQTAVDKQGSNRK